MVGEAIYYVDNNGRGVYFMIIVVKRFTVRKDVSLSTYYPLQNVFYLPNYVVRRTVIYHFRICAYKRVVQSAFCFWYECFQKFWNNCVSLICGLLVCKIFYIVNKWLFTKMKISYHIVYIYLSLLFLDLEKCFWKV